MKPVLILGTGPAGLMAAHACKLKGLPFSIVSSSRIPSVINGAQFVHAALPYLMDDEPDGWLTYHVSGDPRTYQSKVYGDREDVPFVSAQNVRDGQVVPVWSIGRAYNRLWQDIAGEGASISVHNVDPVWLTEQCESGEWHRIVSTIPRPSVCLVRGGYVQGPCKFSAQQIRTAAECRFTLDPKEMEATNHVWYDGTRNVSWYRTSMIFGVGSTEWGSSADGKVLFTEEPLTSVTKPITNTCQCFNGSVLFTGRYGAWRKGILAHQAFIDTWNIL